MTTEVKAGSPANPQLVETSKAATALNQVAGTGSIMSDQMKPGRKVEADAEPKIAQPSNESGVVLSNQNTPTASAQGKLNLEVGYNALDTTIGSHPIFGTGYSEPILAVSQPSFKPTLPGEQVLYLAGLIAMPVLFENESVARDILENVVMPYYHGVTPENTVRVSTKSLVPILTDECRKIYRPGDDVVLTGLKAATAIYTRYHDWVKSAPLLTKMSSIEEQDNAFSSFRKKTMDEMRMATHAKIASR